MGHDAPKVANPGRIQLPTWYYGVAGALVVAGFGTFAWGLQQDAPRAWASYLVGFFFFLSLALAGPFFIATQYLTSAGWSVSVRRIPEAMSAHLIPSALLSVGVFFGAHHLYHWSHHGVTDTDMLLLHKAPYLNLTRMGVFVAIAFVIWIGLAGWITANSRLQDTTGDAKLTQRNAYLSAVFMVLFALSFSTVGIDFLMSLEPHWFSTMWAVYLFSMLMQVGMAVIVLAVVLLRRTGKLEGFVNEGHVHDLGKLTFAFTVFWAYIAFSQFLLIWYANLPEETAFFLKRFDHGWGYVSFAIPFVKFILPFLVLLPKKAKHSPTVLIPITLWIVAVTALEYYWIVMPSVSHAGPQMPWMEVLVFGGFLGVFLAAFGFALSRHAIVPIKDPRLQEAVHHHIL